MGELNSSELTSFFMGLAVLLGSAHVLGEVARRLGQPVVIGEMAAGLILGPSLLGWLAPDFQQWLFPHQGPAATAIDAVVILGVALLLLVAGMEVDLSNVWRQGTTALSVGLGGALIPLAVGGAVAWLAPEWWGMPPSGSPGPFAVFFGVAMAVSALPVIAKILLDLDLLKTDFGMLTLVAATLTNLVAWLVFSVLLRAGEEGHSIAYTVALTLGFVALVLTVGRWLADRLLPWVQAHLVWPGGVLGFVLVAGLAGAAITEAIGIHAIFGAFLAGIALGDSPHLREHTRHIVYRFVEGILAPIFVAAIGLEVSFVTNFHLGLVLRVLILGTILKVLGCSFAARLGGLRGIEVWGIGWAMNARGELGIVLGLIAWQAEVIRERLFVALVILALVSTAVTGPILTRLLRRQRIWSLATLLDSRGCVTDLDASDDASAIRKLGMVAAQRAGLDADEVMAAVLERERMMGTGLGHGVAVPHARLENLRIPVVVLGTAPHGVEFESFDGEPVRLIFLILTPQSDPASQIQILREIAQLTHNASLREEAVAAQSPTSLLASLRVAGALQKSTS